MKKYISAIYVDKLCAQSAATNISSISSKSEIKAKISSPENYFNSFFSLKFLLIGAGVGYITGTVLSLFTQKFYFETLSLAGFLSGAVFGVVSGTFIDLFLIKRKENAALITVEAEKESIYTVIKRLKKARALDIYFTSSNNL